MNTVVVFRTEMPMYGTYKMASGNLCLLFCVSIVLQPVFAGLLKVAVILLIIPLLELQ